MKLLRIKLLEFMVWWHESDVKAIPNEIERLLIEKYQAQDRIIKIKTRINDLKYGRPSVF